MIKKQEHIAIEPWLHYRIKIMALQRNMKIKDFIEALVYGETEPDDPSLKNDHYYEQTNGQTS